MKRSASGEDDSSSAGQKCSCYGTWRVITSFTRACHVTLYWARSTQSNPTSWPSISIFTSHQYLALPKALFPSSSPTKPSMDLSCPPYVPHVLIISYFLFGKLNNTQWTVQNINLFTNQHLPLVLPVCPPHQTVCTYRVYSATGSTLPLAMSTQSVDRAADCTDVCRSVVSLICEGINWFHNSIDMARCKEG
jgi:hypothetical protein